jgi:hypothetical protein
MNRRIYKRLATLSLAAFAAAVFASSAEAQRGMSIASGGRHFARAHRGGRFFAGSAFLPPYYYDDDSPAIEMPPAAFFQFAQPAAPAPPPTPPAESLILELQGDHWVRISNGGQSQTGAPAGAPGSSIDSTPAVAVRRIPAQPLEPPAALPLAVLVFRDRHQEEIARYTIVGSNIIANADYWTTGSWTRKIQIADLDVPETLRLNQQRGAQFKLPSGPNEVIVRP